MQQAGGCNGEGYGVVKLVWEFTDTHLMIMLITYNATYILE